MIRWNGIGFLAKVFGVGSIADVRGSKTWYCEEIAVALAGCTMIDNFRKALNTQKQPTVSTSSSTNLLRLKQSLGPSLLLCDAQSRLECQNDARQAEAR